MSSVYTSSAAGKDEGVDTRKVSKDEAAFILGSGGKTKAKLCAVSGAQIEVTEDKHKGGTTNWLSIRGSPKQRQRARKYVEFVIAQRLGPVKIENPSAHEDLTIMVVPATTVSFITGKQGSFLRLVEDEWSALLFFLQVDPKNPPAHVDPSHTERLAIFGEERRRRGAQLKVMAAIEMKLPNHFTRTLGNSESSEEGPATDTVVIKEEDFTYALGRGGSTRKKLARASNCIVEYVGHVAHFYGTKIERQRAKQYLAWLLQQRTGEQIHVDHSERDDCTMIMVPNSHIGHVAGAKGSGLRSIEEDSNTFCFIESAADENEQKPLLIFGNQQDRRLAQALVYERMAKKVYDKYDDSYDYGYGGWGGGGYKGGKGKGKSKDRDWYGDNRYGGGRDTTEEYCFKGRVHQPSKDDKTDSVAISDDDAAFLMGPGGKTKKKIAAVSGAYLEVKSGRLEVTGNKEERERAQKYVKLVMAQRVGPVKIEEAAEHDDLSVVDVPADAVSFVTGKQGSFLRLVEEEFGTLLFFIDFNKYSKRDQVERLAIFGAQRDRRGAELKVMAAIEMKQPGYFTKRDSQQPLEDPTEGFATDRLAIEEEAYSYALGRGGATRKKIARASGCVIEYIGRYAYLSGTRTERTRAREYLGWLFQQRVGPVDVEFSGRDDVTVLQVPKDCVGFVTGHKGMSLRAVEEATGTFCFIEGGRDDPYRDPKPLLIFGADDCRRLAEERLLQKIEKKQVEGWVDEDGSGGYGGYGSRSYGGGKGAGSYQNSYRKPKGAGKGKQDWGGGGYDDRGGWGTGAAPAANASDESLPSGAASAPTTASAQEAVLADDDADGIWGDWGGSSSDDDMEQTPSGTGAQMPRTPGAGGSGPGGGAGGVGGSGTPSEARHASGSGGVWPRYPAGLYSAAAAAASMSSSPCRAGAAPSTPAGPPAVTSGSPPAKVTSEDFALPPHLLQTEAWPDLGLGAPKKGRK